MDAPIFIAPYFLRYILPFALVFTLIFAILEKTDLLGKDKKQINAIIGLVVALILIASPAVDIVVRLMPFLAVSAVILLVFMLLYAFISGKKDDVLHGGVKVALIIILALGLITALLYITGYWLPIYDFLFNNPSGVTFWINGLILLVIVGALSAVLWGSSKGK